MDHNAPIVQKTYDFYRDLYGAVEKMAKKDKYTLGEKTQKLTLETLELLIAATYGTREKKIELLEQASVKLDALKLFTRLGHELKATDTKKYLHLEEEL